MTQLVPGHIILILSANDLGPLGASRAGDSCQLTLIFSRSSLKVLRHVFFGLPLFLLPSPGTQHIAV